MAQSMLKATAHEDLKRLLSKAQAVDELESTIPSFIERMMPRSYPPYVHVLRIDPQAMDGDHGDEPESMWHQQAIASGQEGQPLGASSGAASELSVKALMDEVLDLKQQVAQLTDLLHTAVPSMPPSPSSHASRGLSEDME
eukprot:GHUV01027641.1.p1 GENE.GHUV01027641.1~~GHUV01027641.1.p1  ORF type:complete len:141 (+),score=53.61 GHUV01027641.1:353-775(+)